MKRTGITNLPLHYGKAPQWLFQRMVKLAREISIIIIEEFGPLEFLKKISDPYWFQSLGCILGFDWHSSGVTTTVCGALKEGLKNTENELGIFITGGKGNTSRKTPDEITEKCDRLSITPDKFIYSSKIVAKVDNSAIQDGFQLYQHNFLFTDKGEWAVIQQGMDTLNKYARRYHWISLDVKSFIEEPHKAICCDLKKNSILNMVAKESKSSQDASVLISKEKPEKIIKEINSIQTLNLPKHHHVDIRDINSKRLYKILLKTYEEKPDDFEKLLYINGVGPKTIRALALISDLIYGVKPSFTDPVRFSFAHGGKDGHPYPVNKEVYDKSIMSLKRAVQKMKADNSEKNNALKRLYEFYSES